VSVTIDRMSMKAAGTTRKGEKYRLNIVPNSIA
jgi:hypothetical protein